MRLPEIGFGLVLVGCLTACAPASRVILLPQTSGQPSRLVTAARARSVCPAVSDS